MTTRHPHPIYIVDDDSDDRLLICEAVKEIVIPNKVVTFESGEDLLRELINSSEKPGLFILDLNMPKMNASELIVKIKEIPEYFNTPIIIFTTSNNRSEIKNIYDLGANSFIQKPNSFNKMVKVLSSVFDYWLNLVELCYE